MNNSDRLRRLGRLTLKELREILRDRRTIVTLVLMPLLLYPLLSIAFQQFFVSQLGTTQTPRYTLGFEDDAQARYLTYLLGDAGVKLIAYGENPPAAAEASGPIVEVGLRAGLEAAVEEFAIDIGLRMRPGAPYHNDPRHDLAVDVELLYRDDSVSSRDAAAFIERRLADAGGNFLRLRLQNLEVTQRAEPVQVVRKAVHEADEVSGAISVTAVVPFILILMTVTGAVYPAIDLTAGERERGTLEVLVAAPIPRLGVLLAKYVAVLSVALLTAAANLLTMTVTIAASGLGRLLFGAQGVSAGVIAAVFGLLLLFAAFFSAVLLVITSSARSFKEAQAYLIPLMLVALAPGMLSLMPDLKLSGLLLVTPLANIVLLGRDLFALKATGAAAVTVVASTLLYAGAAIALAARIFGAESVLYSTQSGWVDLFRRPRAVLPAPTATAALVCLALMLPAYFLFINLAGRLENSVGGQLLAGVVATSVIFGAIPLAACAVRRVAVAPAFGLPPAAGLVFAAALLLGLSLWAIDHETVLVSQKLRGAVLDPRLVERINEYAAGLRGLPAPLVVLALALVPAFFEESFFRGYLYAALRSGTSAAGAICLSAVLFGFFHVVAPNPLASERFLSSTLMGLALGWVRWRSGSVLAGILLHSLHNGLLVLLMYYEPQLRAGGWGIADETHLPALWLAGCAALAGAGLALMYLATRGATARATTSP